MAHISIKKGLDIPIAGKPSGPIQPLITSGGSSMTTPKYLSLNLSSFDDIKFKLLVKVGDKVKIGQPLAEDRMSESRMFCSPASGSVHEIRRGHRRALTDIIIEVAAQEEFHETAVKQVSSREQLVVAMKMGGIFAHIRSRPFNLLADPHKVPRNIFIKAIESAPFVPSAEIQIEGYEEEFQQGLEALTKLTTGSVHLVYGKDSPSKAFQNARNVVKHTAEGPHPIGTYSVHIQFIDPILSVDDLVWTLSAHDVIILGHFLRTGRYFVDKVVSIAGPGVLPGKTGYFQMRLGMPISSLVAGRVDQKTPQRLISGDPLMGHRVDTDQFLGFSHTAFSIIPENTSREFLHFFRLGKDKYSFSKAYLSGHLDNSQREYFFTTNQHGEHRAFVDASLYDRVMPLPIPTMSLVKAVMAEDFDLAEQLGLISTDSEDFALPTFVCPSKMEMTEIIKNGLKKYAHEVLS